MNRATINAALLGSVCIAGLTASPLARAAAGIELGTVSATSSEGGSTQDVDSAPYQAPATTPLDSVQPTALVSRHYIENNVPATGNFDTIIKNTPSIQSNEPNGPGLMENRQLSIRGFQDGQYNVTWDGIPFGDSNDFTHHTTSFFMSNDFGAVEVDRGPGTAATLGNATFGGTIALMSKDPAHDRAITPYATFGSWNTYILGGEFDSGALSSSGTAFVIDAEHVKSDGYLTNTRQERTNLYVKGVQPIGDSTVLTFVGDYNDLHQNYSSGASIAQMAALGKNWGLSEDPKSQDYSGYNYDLIQTDMEYLGLKSDLGDGWSFDDKLYTYAYYHPGYNGLDPSAYAGFNPGNLNGANNANGLKNGDVPAQETYNIYRSYGNIARINKDTFFGTIKSGLWIDWQRNERVLYELDGTQGLTIYNAKGSVNGTDRNMIDTLNTGETFLEVDWKVLPDVTVTPGVKYSFFRRTIDAPVNQKTLLPVSTHKNYYALQPSMEVNWRIRPEWSAYAQFAKGYLAPNLNLLYTTNVAASSVQPSLTMNYQLGTAWQSKRFSASADLYYIPYFNVAQSFKKGGVTIFYDAGSVHYKGVEADVAYSIGYGLTAFANGSINSAKVTTTQLWLTKVPDSTGAFGLIYNQDGIYASLIDKYVGRTFADAANTLPIKGYHEADLALGYTIPKTMTQVAPVTIRVSVNNLFDYRGIIESAGSSANGVPLYWAQVERNYFVKLSATF